MSVNGKKCPMCNSNLNNLSSHGKPKEVSCERCKDCNSCSIKSSTNALGSLSTEDLEKFKQMFMMFDKDGDGTVSTKELGAVMRSIGLYPTEEELEEMIDEADRDDSGTVDFHEFVNLMAKRETEKETEEDLKQVFRVFDKDGNGYISTSEIKFVLTRLGINLSNDDLQEMVIEADINGDQMITFEEFRDIFYEG